MMSCVVTDCLVSYVIPTEAATTAELSDNRALKTGLSHLSPSRHTLLAQGRTFLELSSQFSSLSSLIEKAAFKQ